MKKLLVWAMMLTSIIYVSCAKSEEGDEDKLGSIYGIVTELGTAEPMKAVGVELYKIDQKSYTALFLKTVTFDDGHFEFKDLNPERYLVKVVADGYEQTEEGYVAVEAGRQARIDLQVNRINTYITVKTLDCFKEGSYTSFSGKYRINPDYTSYEKAQPYEVGFVYGTQNNPKYGGTVVEGRINYEEPPYTQFIASSYLHENGTYYVQAYVKNQYGTTYGEVQKIFRK